MGLAVPPKKTRRRRRGVSTGLPTRAEHRNHVWTWDFVHDTTVRGGKLRMLNVIDEYTRECLCIYVSRRIDAKTVRQVLSGLIDVHGAPGYIRSDNGPEFIEKKLQKWLADHEIKTIYIDPGSPWQNGFMESFNARLRDECLDREQLWTLTEARVVLEDWRWHYNHVRPHRSLGYITPTEFAEGEEPTGVGRADAVTDGSGCVCSRPSASLRRSLGHLYHLEQLIHPARLTQAMVQFG
jgi:transposase InsO family protein